MPLSSETRQSILKSYSLGHFSSPGPTVEVYGAPSLYSYFSALFNTSIGSPSAGGADADSVAVLVTFPSEQIPNETVLRRVENARRLDIPTVFVAPNSVAASESSMPIAAASDVILTRATRIHETYESIGGKLLPVRPIHNAGFLSAIVLSGAVTLRETDRPRPGGSSRLRRTRATSHPSPALSHTFCKFPELLFVNSAIPLKVDFGDAKVSTQERLSLGTHGVIFDSEPNPRFEGALPTSATERDTGRQVFQLADSTSAVSAYMTALHAWSASGLDSFAGWVNERLQGRDSPRLVGPILKVEDEIVTAESAWNLIADLAASTLLPRAVHLRTDRNFREELEWLTAPLRRRMEIQIISDTQPMGSTDADDPGDVLVLRPGSRLGSETLKASSFLARGVRHITQRDTSLVIDLVDPSSAGNWTVERNA